MDQTGDYTTRVRDSILRLSVSKLLPDAFDEWHFTGNCVDHEVADEVCELCGQEGLRYHFEIRNDQTKQKLDVGSHCILKFDLAVYEDTRRLTVVEAKKKLQELTRKMRLESCMRALQTLAAKESNQILAGALDYYRKHEKLSPKLAFVVFWKLEQHTIDHDPSFFRVSLRRAKHKQDLEEMDTDRVHRFWKALSSSQRNLAMRLGHEPPQRTTAVLVR